MSCVEQIQISIIYLFLQPRFLDAPSVTRHACLKPYNVHNDWRQFTWSSNLWQRENKKDKSFFHAKRDRFLIKSLRRRERK